MKLILQIAIGVLLGMILWDRAQWFAITFLNYGSDADIQKALGPIERPPDGSVDVGSMLSEKGPISGETADRRPIEHDMNCGITKADGTHIPCPGR